VSQAESLFYEEELASQKGAANALEAIRTSKEEVWNPIPSEPGYEASSFGRVRSRFKILSQNFTRGYLGVQLSSVRRRVNRLVCEAFHGAPPSLKHEAAHKDNNRTNNRADNLVWATSKENKAHQPDKQRGENNPRAILTENDVREIRRLRAQGMKLDPLHRMFPQVSRSMIAYIIQGKTWRHIL
jgi:hypothetical protein